MKRFNKKEYTDARKRIRTFIKENHRLPNYCNMKNQEGKTIRLSKEEFCGLFEGYMTFCLKHGREPNYLTLISTAETSPIICNLQDDQYSCCPTSLQMCMMFLFEYKSEAKVKKVLGTNKKGTSPAQLIAGAKKLGYKVTKIPREFRAVKSALDQYCPVIMQIETRSASCLGFKQSFGHYIVCYKAKDNKYYVIDPTKSYKVCNFQVLNRATGGSKTRYFYKVEIL